jgi:hypothetical protein
MMARSPSKASRFTAEAIAPHLVWMRRRGRNQLKGPPSPEWRTML